MQRQQIWRNILTNRSKLYILLFVSFVWRIVPMALMLVSVVVFYTICSLSDKFAISVAKLNGDQLSFLMAASTALFMLPCIPFVDFSVSLCWQSAAAVIALAVNKILEFKMSAIIYTELSAFELKAWLGVTLFMSYAADIYMGAKASAFCLAFIAVTVIGLVFIAKAGNKKKINYRHIVLALIVYLIDRFMYGITIKASESYISSTAALFFGLIVMALVLLPFVKPVKLAKENPKGFWVVTLTKIPNVAGLLLENAIIARSLTSGSFIAPMTLCALFIIALIRKEESSRLGLAGSIISVVGIVGFQLAAV